VLAEDELSTPMGLLHWREGPLATHTPKFLRMGPTPRIALYLARSIR
jgi:hypothetical protein